MPSRGCRSSARLRCNGSIGRSPRRAASRPPTLSRRWTSPASFPTAPLSGGCVKPALAAAMASRYDAGGASMLLSAAQEGAYHLRHRLRTFEMRQVTSLLDEFDPCVGDSSSKLLSISRRDDAVGRAPDDERRRRNPVSVPAESAIGDRPDEFTRAGLRPDELRERVDALGWIARNIEETPRGLSVGVGKKRGPSDFVAEDHPVLHRGV